jgi:hypothetical protein
MRLFSRRATIRSLELVCCLLIGTFAVPVTRASGYLTVQSTSLNFGNVVVGNMQAINVSLKNTGSSALILSGHALIGAGFSTSGIVYPMTIGAGVTVPLSVRFSPTKTGLASGSVQFYTTSANGTVVMSLSGTGVTASPTTQPATSTLVLTPSTLNFGSVAAGQTVVTNITLTNTGSSTLNLASHTVTGAPFSTSGIVYPMNIGPRVVVPLSIKFHPTATGAYSGNVQFFYGGQVAKLTLTGTGASSASGGYARANPIAASFGNVPVGTKNTQSIQLTNTGNASYTVSSITASGSGFSVSGPGLPVSVAPGANVQFSVGFSPQSVGSFTGSVLVKSTASDSQVSVAVSGSGVSSSPGLSVSPTNLTFGSISVGATESQTIRLQNTGNSNLTVSSVAATGSAFAATGIAGNTVLAAGQAATLTVSFSPTATGTISGTIAITSNASNSPTFVVPLSGSGGSGSKTVNLQWQASTTSGLAGYNVYRSSTSGGPYSKLASLPIVGTSYTDSTVTSSATYYYVVTAVSVGGVESSYSAQVTVVVP